MRITFLCKRRYTGSDVISDRFGRRYQIPFQRAGDHADDGSTGQVTPAIWLPTIAAATAARTSRIYGRDHELPGYA